jgi:hypothetical protein
VSERSVARAQAAVWGWLTVLCEPLVPPKPADWGRSAVRGQPTVRRPLPVQDWLMVQGWGWLMVQSWLTVLWELLVPEKLPVSERSAVREQPKVPESLTVRKGLMVRKQPP